ncbi:MAG: hypothetical protein DMF30_05150 [Verrucomicrobia bacterium]|nr:MAG: hypothetical protein DMF30_05150 [Verrucomicrobiota bacterium]
MKLNLFFIIPSLAILASAATSDDTEGGWNNAHWGMTAQQIRETYPSSQMLSTPETYQFGGGRYICSLVLPNVPIADETFNVHFRMDRTSSLAAVQIQRDFPITAKGKSVFNTIRDMLTQKYGAAVSDDDASNSSFAPGSRTVKWQCTNMQIILRYLITPRSGECRISIAYQKPQSTENL